MKLWGGNYSTDPDAAFWEFNRSFPFDRRLLPEEIAASQAYVRALGRAKSIPTRDAERLADGLGEVLKRARRDPAYLELDAEDVHSFVETRLGEIVGDLAGQAHLGRSRNEQAVTALRLWIRVAIDVLRDGVRALVEALAEKGRAGAASVMPGYTHTRAAEPITFGHWAAAHAWGLVRDFERLGDARRRVDVLPLGSGALAGTALPIDREALARELGFAAVSESALDAVMDRDFAIEFVACCATLQMHFSRMAEDLIWLSSPEFGFFPLRNSNSFPPFVIINFLKPAYVAKFRFGIRQVKPQFLRMKALLFRCTHPKGKLPTSGIQCSSENTKVPHKRDPLDKQLPQNM